MRIVIAPDSYKGSLTAKEVCTIIESAFTTEIPGIEIDSIPMADGGEGTVDAFIYATKGERVEVTATGPMGKRISTYYGVLGNKKTAVIEMATMAGLTLVPEEERNPLQATTYGVGECLLDAMDKGFSHVIVGIGGSATNDGGIGMLQALGVKFLNENNEELPPFASSLALVTHADFSGLDERIFNTKIQVACDVDNPLCGPDGASHIFGPQKGATPELIEELDKALYSYATTVERNLQKSYQLLPGAGAAGGIGFALMTIGAELISGAELVANATNLEERFIKADWIITGEGKTDRQTLHGKVPHYIAKLAKKIEKPVLLLSGSIAEDVDEFYDYFTSLHGIVSEPVPLEYAILNARQLLFQKAKNLARLISLHKKEEV